MSDHPMTFGLLSLCIVLVRRFADKFSCENSWVCLHNNPVRITGPQTGNGHASVDQTRSPFEEHLAHGDAIELLRTKCARRLISCALVLFGFLRSPVTVHGQRFAEAGFPQSSGMCHVTSPRCRPTYVLDEGARLAKGKINSCDPRARLYQRALEAVEP